MINIGSVAVSVVPSAEGFRERLEAQLRDLPSVKVTLETAAAETKIEEIRAALDSIRTQHVKVDVDDNGSAARTKSKIDSMGDGAGGVSFKVALIGAGLLALIPIAAAASAAIAGIGLGAGIGIAGALIGKLALGGVPAAFTAGNAARTNPQGGQQAAQQAQQVSAAVNTQRQAEIGLVVAQRNAVDAQRALTQARIDAAQTLQSLTNQVTDNGLAQRQAVLDLATASQNLRVAKANPDVANSANANALSQVQLQFDQAKQHLLELQEAGTQVAAQKATADALGVDGSLGVVAAQNKVVDSNNAVAQAQFQVTNSAQQVALAQSASTGAMNTYAAAVAKLNPAQKQFLTFLQSIRGQFSQLSGAASAGLLPGLQTAISNLLPVLPSIAGFIGKIASGFGDLAVNASKALTGPFWSQFFAFLDKITNPAIGTFGAILGDLFTIAAAAFQAFYPAIKAVGDALVPFLDHLAASIQGGSLKGFTDYVVANLPRVGNFLEAFGKAIGHLITAVAPLGGAALDGLTALLDAFNKVPTSVILAAAGALLAYAAASKALPIIKAGASLVQLAVANPEIAAVAALAAGFAILYVKSKTFRDEVNTNVLPVLKKLGDYFIGTVWPILKKIGSDALEGLRVAFDRVGNAIKAHQGAFGDLINFVITKVLPVLGPILQYGFEVLGFAISLVIDSIGQLIKAIEGVITAGKNVGSALGTAFTDTKNFVSNVVNAITGIPGKLLGFGQSFADAGSKLMGKIFDGLESAAKNTVGFVTDFAKDMANAFIRTLDNALGLPYKIPQIDLGFGVKIGGETLIPKIPTFALGGFLQPGPNLVGELGPEMLWNDPTSKQVFTASQTRQMQDNAGTAGSGKQITQHFQLPMTDPVAIAYTAQRLVQFA